MKSRTSEWQPLDLVDQEAVVPLTSVRSHTRSKERLYYSLENQVYSDSEENEETHFLSEVKYIGVDPIEDEEIKLKTRRLRRAVYLLAFSIVAITCLVVVILFQHFNRPRQDQICTTAECVSQSAYILDKMDTSVDPCKDFYTFTCGNWLKKTELPPTKMKIGSFQQIGDEIQTILKEIIEDPEVTYKGAESSAIHKAKAYYNMCMDDKQIEAAGVEPALQLINDLGRWTLTSDATSGIFDEDIWSLQDAVLLSHRLEFSPLFVMVVTIDAKNSSRHIIGFEQSGLTLGDARNYFTNHTQQKKLKDAFIQFGVDLIGLLGNTDNVTQEITDLYKFEQQLAEIFIPENQLLDPEKVYHKMTLQEFQDNHVGSWLSLEEYMDGMFIEKYEVSMDTEVIVFTPEYFNRLDNFLSSVGEKTLANYIVWHGVSSLVGYLTPDFLEVSLKLDQAQSGLKEYPPKWKRCLNKAVGTFGFAVGALYVQDNFDVKERQEVESLFEEIRKAFIANIATVEWMDGETAAFARDKAENVSKMLGFPDILLDPVKLDKKYENISLVENNLFETKLAINRFYRNENLWRYGKAPDRTKWSMDPTEVNGYYNAKFNTIVFPAGILRPPLYNPTSPKSFNFGSFGMICGHELTHGFDDKGREFDKEGNMRSWWTDTSAEKFEELTKCFVEFYSNYSVDGTNLDGRHTLSENIADNGGMKTAYLAYQSWKATHQEDSIILPGMSFSSDQLFFIGMAQIWCSHYTDAYLQQAILTDAHSIAKYRVLGSMSNSDFFASAFSCPANSPMNPTHKCKVW